MSRESVVTSRRAALKCLAFGGAGTLFALAGGVFTPIDLAVAAADRTGAASLGKPLFVQISDSHIGFNKEANPDVVGTLNRSIDAVNALAAAPALVIHTGDITHLSKPAEFDHAQQLFARLRVAEMHTVPGEHDTADDAGQKYRQAFGAGSLGDGWYSFDIAGVHVIALVNTVHLPKLGQLGAEQLEWIEKDVAGLSSDTPIIVFSHIPMFAMYPDWGWGTEDAAQALSYLKRFSSVTCLNGHVHQLFTKTEGNVTFYTGTTTAYPLPHPGDGPAPKPVTLPAGKLHDALGIREVSYTKGQTALALKEATLQ